MDKIIKMVIFRTQKDNFIIYQQKVHRYILHSGEIFKSFNVEKMIRDAEYYKNVYSSGFNEYSYDGPHELSIPLLLEYQKKEKWREEESLKDLKEYNIKDLSKKYIITGDIILDKKITKEDVQSFYEMELEVVVKGLRTKFLRSQAYRDKIYIDNPREKNRELECRLSELFGEPQAIPELEYERDGTGYYSRFFIAEKKDITKIIGVRRYRDIETFGQEGGEKYTGVEDEIVLDLAHYDETIYDYFLPHHMFEFSD